MKVYLGIAAAVAVTGYSGYGMWQGYHARAEQAAPAITLDAATALPRPVRSAPRYVAPVVHELPPAMNLAGRAADPAPKATPPLAVIGRAEATRRMETSAWAPITKPRAKHATPKGPKVSSLSAPKPGGGYRQITAVGSIKNAFRKANREQFARSSGSSRFRNVFRDDHRYTRNN